MAGWWRGGVLVLVAAVLAGCSGNLASALGMGKRAPDEFAVVRRQPLIVPPNFDLRPPRADAEGAQAAAADREARAALTRTPVQEAEPARAAGSALLTRPGAAATSPGEGALLSRTGEAGAAAAPQGEGAAPAATDRSLLDRVTRPAGPDEAAARPAAAPAERLQSGNLAGASSEQDPDLARLQAPLEDLQ